MSRQRRVERTHFAAKICRSVLRLGSRLLRGARRLCSLEESFRCPTARSIARASRIQTAPPAIAAWLATNSLHPEQSNRRSKLRAIVRIRSGPPSLGSAAIGRLDHDRSQDRSRNRSYDRSPGITHIPSPVVSSRFDRALPWAPALICCRTERYDGKGNLHFKHAA
jgi:hypothetical protein